MSMSRTPHYFLMNSRYKIAQWIDAPMILIVMRVSMMMMIISIQRLWISGEAETWENTD